MRTSARLWRRPLVAAQLQSEETRANAEKQSQAIVRDAEVRAKAVVDDLQAQASTVQQTLIQLKLLEEDFRFKFRALLEGYLRLVEEGPILLSGLATDALGRRAGGDSRGTRARRQSYLGDGRGGCDGSRHRAG